MTMPLDVNLGLCAIRHKSGIETKIEHYSAERSLTG
jgi:hypothetical protein